MRRRQIWKKTDLLHFLKVEARALHFSLHVVVAMTVAPVVSVTMALAGRTDGIAVGYS